MINGKYNSLRSFSSDRSYTLNRSSYARDSMMIEELLVPAKDQVCAGFDPARGRWWGSKAKESLRDRLRL